MKDQLTFKDKKQLRSWLEKHHQSHDAIWIRFDKQKLSSSLTADEALKEALCFGWIDSTIKRIDDNYYIKYFAKRRAKSIWSKKNKAIVKQLIEEGLMTHHGLAAIEVAKKNGMWDKQDEDNDDQRYLDFLSLVKPEERAYKNLINMSKSVQKTYAQHYFSAKKESTKVKRFAEIIERLSKNLAPM